VAAGRFDEEVDRRIDAALGDLVREGLRHLFRTGGEAAGAAAHQHLLLAVGLDLLRLGPKRLELIY